MRILNPVAIGRVSWKLTASLNSAMSRRSRRPCGGQSPLRREVSTSTLPEELPEGTVKLVDRQRVPVFLQVEEAVDAVDAQGCSDPVLLVVHPAAQHPHTQKSVTPMRSET